MLFSIQMGYSQKRDENYFTVLIKQIFFYTLMQDSFLKVSFLWTKEIVNARP